MQKPDETLDSAFDEKDESDILSNQDETDLGDVNTDDPLMGAGPTNEFNVAGEPGDFARGELDVTQQMDRNARAFEHKSAKTMHSPEQDISPEEFRNATKNI